VIGNELWLRGFKGAIGLFDCEIRGNFWEGAVKRESKEWV